MDTQVGITIELDNLIRVSWILLIPIGVLLAVVLYKLAVILHGASEFMSIARYELYPTIKDLRKVAGNAEILSDKAVSGAEVVEKGLGIAEKAAERGVDNLKDISSGFMEGSGSFVGGFLRSLVFGKKKK